MGVDFYNCTNCNHIFADSGEYYTCCVCQDYYCVECKNELYDVPKECDGDCLCLGYEDSEDENEDTEEECHCHQNLVDLYYEDSCCNGHDDGHNVCQKCVTREDPYKVSYKDMVYFLLKESKYTFKEAKKACRESKKKKL